ncbi:hypothetical protein IU449_27440 [Nocardia higoensis]|uniref:HK97 gp10 family phage protein n=1 Tax=Nocardia higoensis TaxID=228599 RepID=A0ABS0DIE9_9NOCA|nr:hypothetical protein [Nocardia higoensis]MBF6358236.1 hypothetical protein [Nocardia higoensis]
MGLWEDAQHANAESDRAAQQRQRELSDRARRQRDQLREFVEAMNRLGVAVERYRLHATKIAYGDTYCIDSRKAVTGWSFYSWSDLHRTFHYVVTPELEVYNTATQRMEPGFMGFGQRWTVTPLDLPIDQVRGLSYSERPLEQALKEKLAQLLRER